MSIYDTEIQEGIPDEHCPKCGADVDENCEQMDNCPRYRTGQYDDGEK